MGLIYKVLVECCEDCQVDLESALLNEDLRLNYLKVHYVFLLNFTFGSMMVALIEMDLLKFDPFFRDHIAPALVTSIPKLHVLISLRLAR